jgi:hypothetical protein
MRAVRGGAVAAGVAGVRALREGVHGGRAERSRRALRGGVSGWQARVGRRGQYTITP